MRTAFISLCLLLFSAILLAQDSKYRNLLSKDIYRLEIVRHPASDVLPCRTSELPRFDGTQEIDIRSCSFSDQDFSNRLSDITHASFDDKTVWPSRLPMKFDPKKIMELGKNPGLSIGKLHKKGITGKRLNGERVGVAIIDQALLVDHVEYKDRLKMYEEIHLREQPGQMHGSALASIIVGKDVGVAPEADLYYIAEEHGEYVDDNSPRGYSFQWDISWIAKSIDRIIEVNKTLTTGNKIRVISISLGIGPKLKGYEDVKTAIKNAKEQKPSIYVVYVDSDPFLGLGRNPLKDPDDISSYQRGFFWEKYSYDNTQLLVPMDSRTTASPTGINDYAFYYDGGMSWAVPYVAGLYALACQVKPDITPELFWQKALATSDTITVSNNGKKEQLGKIVNPNKLIDSLQNIKAPTNN